jgi:SlyX protein
MADDLERRMTEVELKLAYAEQTAEDLSAVVIEQGRRIDALQQQISELLKRLEEAATWDPSSQDDRPPPHY